MKKIVLFGFALILIQNKASTQNLVKDPGFEDYRELPCEIGSNQESIGELLHFWSQPTPNSTDYWNLLADTSCILNPSTPSMIFGQSGMPRNGNGMGGIIVYDYRELFETNPTIQLNYREYYQTKLIKKLNPENLYKSKLYTTNGKFESIISNNLGVYFSENELNYTSDGVFPEPLNFTPHINSDIIIENTTDTWTEVSGCFAVESTREYMIIGNFFEDDLTKTKIINPINNLSNTAYYFIDDVSVEKLQYNITALSKEETFCFSEKSLTLIAFVEGANSYEWDDGSEEPTFVVHDKRSRTYSVDISFSECTYNHSFKVNFVPDIDLGSDTLLCYGENIVLEPKYTTGSFEWFDSSFDSVKIIDQPGDYWVNASSGCIVRDTISVDFIDCPGLIPNAFTPNKDAYNQFFEIQNIENRQWALGIYNRLGKQVFWSDDYQNDWSGDNMPSGTYYYCLTSKGMNKKITGWVSILN